MGNFSKFSVIFILHGTFDRKLTFEIFHNPFPMLHVHNIHTHIPAHGCTRVGVEGVGFVQSAEIMDCVHMCGGGGTRGGENVRGRDEAKLGENSGSG